MSPAVISVPAWRGTALCCCGCAQSHDWCNRYNTALDQYRLKQDITNPGRPMPNLAFTEKEMELPFWIYADHQPRQRLALQNNDGLHVISGNHRIDVTDLLNGDLLSAAEKLRQRLESATLRVRPRADADNVCAIVALGFIHPWYRRRTV